MPIRLTIITPERIHYEGNVEHVYAHNERGEFGVLPGHAAMISTLKAGRVRFLEKGKRQTVQVRDGFVEVLHNNVLMVTDGIEDPGGSKAD